MKIKHKRLYDSQKREVFYEDETGLKIYTMYVGERVQTTWLNTDGSVKTVLN